MLWFPLWTQHMVFFLTYMLLDLLWEQMRYITNAKHNPVRHYTWQYKKTFSSTSPRKAQPFSLLKSIGWCIYAILTSGLFITGSFTVWSSGILDSSPSPWEIHSQDFVVVFSNIEIWTLFQSFENCLPWNHYLILESRQWDKPQSMAGAKLQLSDPSHVVQFYCSEKNQIDWKKDHLQIVVRWK